MVAAGPGTSKGPTAYRPTSHCTVAIFTRFDRYSFNPILFRESRHIMSQLNGDRFYYIDTSLSQHLVNYTKHNKCVVGLGPRSKAKA